MSRKSDETRARILQTTLDLLASAEPQKTRVSDIAKAAGISRQVNIDASLAPSRTAEMGEDRLDAFIAAWAGHIPVIYPIGRALMAMMDSDPEARAAWTDRMAAVRHGCAAAVAAIDRDGGLRRDLDATRATDLLWSLLSVRLWEHLTRDCGWSDAAYRAEVTRLARAALLEAQAAP